MVIIYNRGYLVRVNRVEDGHRDGHGDGQEGWVPAYVLHHVNSQVKVFIKMKI